MTSVARPAPFMAWVSHTTVSSCSSSVPRYAVSITCSTFLAIASSSLRGNDERVVGGLGELHQVGRAAATGAGNGFGGAALVDAEAALHPVDLAALALGLGHDRGHPVLGIRVVLLGDVAAVHGVGVGRLLGEGHV